MDSSTDHDEADEAVSRVSSWKPTVLLPQPFLFVPMTGAEAAAGRIINRQKLRSHVTKVQHATRSKREGFVPARNAPIRSSSSRTRAQDDETDSEATTEASASLSSQSQHSASTSPGLDSATSMTSRSQGEENQLILVPRLPTGSASEDPFWTFPIDQDPLLPPIVTHYIENIAVEIPDLDGPIKKGLMRRSWFPMCMTDAATMYSILLMSAAHLRAVQPQRAAEVDVLSLKARALAAINTTMSQKTAATSDTMIAAVAKMAAFEAIFGDGEVYHAHMRGLSTMIKMRGGFSELGMNGLLERLILWVELNACHLTGQPRVIDRNELPSRVFFNHPDLLHFTGSSENDAG